LNEISNTVTEYGVANVADNEMRLLITDLRAARAEVERLRQLAYYGDASDKPIPEDASIAAAHPSKTGDYATYAEAQRLVSAKRSKFGIIALVNWLLSMNNACRDRVAELEHEQDVTGERRASFDYDKSEDLQ
jgi:hypothetical protein